MTAERTPTEILLVPRGDADPGARWSDPRPHKILVAREDAVAWYGRPSDNPACPELVYPKFAWSIWTPAD